MNYRNDYVEIMISFLVEEGYCPDDLFKDVYVDDNCSSCTECWKKCLKENK